MYVRAKLWGGVLASALAMAATTAEAGDVVLVNSGAELKAAIVQANSDPSIETIKCAEAGACNVFGTLPTYTGSHRLTIDGKFSRVNALGITDTDAFAATGGGILKLMRLTIKGGLSGVYVEVPADKSGTQRVELQRVVVRDAHLHGVLVDDSAASDASIRLIVGASKFIDNGYGGDGFDGIFVDEKGIGEIVAKVTGSRFLRNASDGLSLDEEDDGDVTLTVTRGYFLENGSNPADLSDPDDGVDVDEGGLGDVWVVMSDSRANKNHDDGIDLDERDEGSLFSNMDEIKANKNLDQGVVVDERLAGDIFATINNSNVSGNDAESQGYDIRGDQLDEGNGTLTVENVVMGGSILHGVQLITLP